MNTNIKTTNVTLTQEIADYVAKRLAKIDKLIGPDPTIQCDLELARTTEHHQKGQIFKAEMHIVGSGKNIYASCQKGDLYSAIDLCRDSVVRELTHGKGKKISLVRRSGSRVKEMLRGLWPQNRR
jgi:ribosomal subunit interface protein